MKERENRIHLLFDILNTLYEQQKAKEARDELVLKSMLPTYNDMLKAIMAAMRFKIEQLMYKKYGSIMIRMQYMNIRNSSYYQSLLPNDIKFVKQQSLAYEKKPLFHHSSKRKQSFIQVIPQLLHYQILNNQILYNDILTETKPIQNENHSDSPSSNVILFREGIPFIPWSNDQTCLQRIPASQRKYDKLLFPTIRSLILQQSMIFQKQQSMIHKNKLQLLRFFAIQCTKVAIKRIEMGNLMKKRKQTMQSSILSKKDQGDYNDANKYLSITQSNPSAKIIKQYIQQLQKQELSIKKYNTELNEKQKMLLQSFEQSTTYILQQIMKLDEVDINRDLKDLENFILVRKIAQLKTVNSPVYQRFARMCELLPNVVQGQRSVIQLRDMFNPGYTLLFKASLIYMLYAATQLKRQHIIINRVDPIQFLIASVTQLIHLQHVEQKTTQSSFIIYVNKDNITTLLNSLRESLSSLIYHILVINDINIDNYSNDEHSDRYEDYKYTSEDYEHIQFDFLCEKHLSKVVTQKTISKVNTDRKINLIIINAENMHFQYQHLQQYEVNTKGKTIIKSVQSYIYKEINQFRKQREIQTFDYQFLLDVGRVQEFYGFTFQSQINIYSDSSYNQPLAAINMCSLIKQQDQLRLNNIFSRVQNELQGYMEDNSYKNQSESKNIDEHDKDKIENHELMQFISRSKVLQNNIKEIRKKSISFISKIQYVPNAIIVEQSMNKKNIILHNIINESYMLTINACINIKIICHILDLYQQNVKLSQIQDVERKIYQQFQRYPSYYEYLKMSDLCLEKLNGIAEGDLKQYNKTRIKVASSFKFSAVQVNTAVLKEMVSQYAEILQNQPDMLKTQSHSQINDITYKHDELKIKYPLNQIQMLFCEGRNAYYYSCFSNDITHKLISNVVTNNIKINQSNLNNFVFKQMYTQQEVKQIRQIMLKQVKQSTGYMLQYQKCINTKFGLSNLIMKERYGQQSWLQYFDLVKTYVMHNYLYNGVWESIIKLHNTIMYLQELFEYKPHDLFRIQNNCYYNIFKFNTFPSINYQQVSIQIGQKRKQSKIVNVTNFFDPLMQYKVTIPNSLLSYQNLIYTSSLLEFYNKSSVKQLLKVIDGMLTSGWIAVVIPDIVTGQQIRAVIKLAYKYENNYIIVINPTDVVLHLERQNYILYNLHQMDIHTIVQMVTNNKGYDQTVYSINERLVQKEKIAKEQETQTRQDKVADVLRYLVGLDGKHTTNTEQVYAQPQNHQISFQKPRKPPVEDYLRFQLRLSWAQPDASQKAPVHTAYTWRYVVVWAAQATSGILPLQPPIQRLQHFLLSKENAIHHLGIKYGAQILNNTIFALKSGNQSQRPSQKWLMQTSNVPSRVQQHKQRVYRHFLDAIYNIQVFPIVMSREIKDRRIFGPCSFASSWISIIRRLLTVSIRFSKPFVSVQLKHSNNWFLRSQIHQILIPGLFGPMNVKLSSEFTTDLNILLGEEEMKQKRFPHQVDKQLNTKLPLPPPITLLNNNASSLQCNQDYVGGVYGQPGIWSEKLRSGKGSSVHSVDILYKQMCSSMGIENRRWEALSLLGAARASKLNPDTIPGLKWLNQACNEVGTQFGGELTALRALFERRNVLPVVKLRKSIKMPEIQTKQRKMPEIVVIVEPAALPCGF